MRQHKLHVAKANNQELVIAPIPHPNLLPKLINQIIELSINIFIFQ